MIRKLLALTWGLLYRTQYLNLGAELRAKEGS